MRTLEEEGEVTIERPGVDPEREHIRRRLMARQDFGSHLTAYLVINTLLVVVWATTGAGYFWPGWVLAGWGTALILHARETFWRRPISDADVDAEIRRRTSREGLDSQTSRSSDEPEQGSREK